MNDSSVCDTKVCSKCRRDLPKSEFYKRSRTSQLLTPDCKACNIERSKAYSERKLAERGPLPPRKETAAARLWARVDRRGPVPGHVPHLGECWVWTGAVDKMGYGQIGRTNPRRLELVHRFSWELAHGPAGDLCVLHRCDNPRCVRPEHLFLGTRTDNMEDKIRKGRQTRGEGFSNAVLSADVVSQIRDLHASGVRMIAISRLLGIRYGSVSNVVHGRSWKHVR